MEKFNLDNSGHAEIEKTVQHYLKDFPLTTEDLQKPLLDVGAGTGKFVRYLREVLGNDKVVGVEVYPQKIGATEGLVAADGFRLPFEDDTFEIVTVHNYLPMFVEDPAKMQSAILELLRVVKKEGRIMGDIATPEEVVKSEDQTKRNLGEEHNERQRNIFLKRHSGAHDLQSFLAELGKIHDVEFTSPKKNVVVITKQ